MVDFIDTPLEINFHLWASYAT